LSSPFPLSGPFGMRIIRSFSSFSVTRHYYPTMVSTSFMVASYFPFQSLSGIFSSPPRFIEPFCPFLTSSHSLRRDVMRWGRDEGLSAFCLLVKDSCDLSFALSFKFTDRVFWLFSHAQNTALDFGGSRSSLLESNGVNTCGFRKGVFIPAKSNFFFFFSPRRFVPIPSFLKPTFPVISVRITRSDLQRKSFFLSLPLLRSYLLFCGGWL